MQSLQVAALSISGALAFASGPKAPAKPAPAAVYPVTITVTNLKSTTAPISLGFYNTKETYPKFGKHVFRKPAAPDGKNTVTVPVDLASGEWAVAVYQDLNNNGTLDMNAFGIPKEPVAFSNNVRPRFKAPGFAECKFDVKGPGQSYTIAMP